jgi:ubiquinone/menaquinone biosynthesis C-methylase UbiE
VTLLDIPVNALTQAAERAAEDLMSEKVNIVSASGTALPFFADSFDRVSHSDVLCCLPEKLELLAESRRVVGLGAITHFSVILPAEGISQSDHQAVLQTGPPFVGVDGCYPDLLHEAGWQTEECEDVTAEYQSSLQRLVDGTHEHEQELLQLFGEEELIAKRSHREDQITLIDRGLMRREAYVAVAT